MRRAVHVALSLCLLTLAATATAQSPIRYIYDELGRLVGVIDANGDAAEYHYDAVGNLLSITRSSPTQVTIIDFSPDAGPIGQTVTIQGTGFSATAGQNTVTFNGTSATVPPRRLLACRHRPLWRDDRHYRRDEPERRGYISNVVCRVTADGPTISSFSPTSAVAGTSVAITGTNFDATTPTNNQRRFNITLRVPPPRRQPSSLRRCPTRQALAV